MSPTILWLIAGGVFIAVEIFGMPGIGFLFAGLGALLTGGAIELGLLPPDDVTLQFLVFLATACISAALLWKRLKRNPKSSYSNIVGTEATVAAPGLSGKKEGQVKWSGTLMRAYIAEGAGVDVLAADATVIVKSIEGNVLFVAPKR